MVKYNTFSLLKVFDKNRLMINKYFKIFVLIFFKK